MCVVPMLAQPLMKIAACEPLPQIRVADPDRGPRFVDFPFTADGDCALATVPPLDVGQMLLVEAEPISESTTSGQILDVQ